MSIPQRIAAIPAYITSHNKDSFNDVAPGHKFLGYFRNWQGSDGDAFAPYKGKARLIGQIPPGPQKRAANDQLKSEFDAVLNEVCALPATSTAQVSALRARQQALIQHHGSNGYRVSTTSTAPFATGLGNEHPIENGFAFLTPYGLPYLAGSGVKGILRRAAEELALENEAQEPQGWRWTDIWWLFGFEGSCGKDDEGSIWDSSSALGHAFARDLNTTAIEASLYPLIRRLIADDKKFLPYTDPAQDGARQFLHACLAEKSLRGGLQARGALDFWDVFPSPAGDKLVVEIMTPHYSKYYQGQESPHDSGAPVPVSFLAVPAKSKFDFHVVCHTGRLPQDLASQWRTLLDDAFRHAFEWVGFGAKTSVGYGAMAAIGAKKDAVTNAATSSAQAATSSRLESWPTARLKFNKNNNTLTAEANGKSASAYAPHSEALLKSLPADVQSKIRQNQCFQKFAVQVEGAELRAIAP